jgi:putative radical SAM enzyme (TIGR03279 family)
VDPGSPAESAGIEAGDVIVSMNGRPVRDVIDYRYRAASHSVRLEVKKRGGERIAVTIENRFDPRLGLNFEDAVFDGERRCANRCVFCFVDQLPPGLRESLYVKDDDYRLSFLQGNFVTLTNLTRGDMRRILAYRLSPLYVSVHSTDEAVRRVLLGRHDSPPIMPALRAFARERIEFHAQIVLVPGVNDGALLDRTISDLLGIWPACCSVGIVPVGLTSQRASLPVIQPVSPERARAVLGQVRRAQGSSLEAVGSRFVFAADELYYLAGEPIPLGSEYEGYPQLENGVGLARLFLDEFSEISSSLPQVVEPPRRLTVVTGVLGSQVLGPACDRLREVSGVELELVAVENQFFGQAITVSGLVVGRDIIRALSGLDPGQAVLIPDVMLRRGAAVFLDDLTPADIQQALGVRVLVIPATPRGLCDAVLAPGFEVE